MSIKQLGDSIFGGIPLPEGGTQGLTPGSPGPIAPDDQDVRNDPRHGSKLEKRRIQKDDGSGTITIDYNPKTGGVFLDKGELKDLSQIKNIEAILKNVLSQ
jgi:hypothetical protein